MAAYDLEEQEQLATIKAWWAAHGGLVSTVAMALAIGIVGWRAWGWYEVSSATKASAVYAALQDAAKQNDLSKTKEASGLIAEKYSTTAYADYAALQAAQVLAQGGDIQNAKAKLTWAVEKGNDPLLRDLARLRLAAVLLDNKEYDAALKQLSVKPAEAFVPRFGDLRGDVLLAQGKKTEAKAAYKEALDLVSKLKDDGAANMKQLLELKLDGLGGAQ